MAFAFSRAVVVSVADKPATSPRVVPGGGIATPKGFRASGITAGFKPSGVPDFALILAENDPAVAAGVFTQSTVAAAPVLIGRESLKSSQGRAKAVLINSGQANACTGAEGHQDAVDVIEELARQLSSDADVIPPNQILMSSTGVVGRRFDVGKMKGALPALVESARKQEGHGDEAAKAIMTTDLVQKSIALELETEQGVIRMGGMAKGSGMICPNMATMLSYVTTDAVVEPSAWQAMLSRAADRSFNQITVDGDTSTNDTLIALASGASELEVPDSTLESMLTKCCQYLAKCIARDGEGATVLLEVVVTGAVDGEGARRIAKFVANSSLFKAAVYGRDPNWGRIAVAAGNAGVLFDPSKLDIALGPFKCMTAGRVMEYDEAGASAYMQSASEAEYLSGDDTVRVTISVGDGPGEGLAWGCDLSYNYVKINAEYTT